MHASASVQKPVLSRVAEHRRTQAAQPLLMFIYIAVQASQLQPSLAGHSIHSLVRVWMIWPRPMLQGMPVHKETSLSSISLNFQVFKVRSNLSYGTSRTVKSNEP